MGAIAQRQVGAHAHVAVVDALARELDLPVDKVAGAYFEEVARLESAARIKTFVSVLAVCSVRNQFRRPPGSAV